MTVVAHPDGFTAYGVDACRGGLLVAVLRPVGRADSFVAASMGDLVALVGNSDWVFDDMPIGLRSDTNERRCDVAAWVRLKPPRASSVFPRPVRDVFAAAVYGPAGDVSDAVTGKRLSRQTWAIAPRIAEVDALLRRCAGAVPTCSPDTQAFRPT